VTAIRVDGSVSGCSWFASGTDLASRAGLYPLHLIPDLLQPEAYATAAIRSTQPGSSTDQIAELTAITGRANCCEGGLRRTSLSLLAGIRTQEARALRWDDVVVWVDDAIGWQPVTRVGFDQARAGEDRFAIYVWRAERAGGIRRP
jgi:hypothetical protein